MQSSSCTCQRSPCFRSGDLLLWAPLGVLLLIPFHFQTCILTVNYSNFFPLFCLICALISSQSFGLFSGSILLDLSARVIFYPNLSGKFSFRFLNVIIHLGLGPWAPSLPLTPGDLLHLSQLQSVPSREMISQCVCLGLASLPSCCWTFPFVWQSPLTQHT